MFSLNSVCHQSQFMLSKLKGKLMLKLKLVNVSRCFCQARQGVEV